MCNVATTEGQAAADDGPVPEDSLDPQHSRLLRASPGPLHVSQVQICVLVLFMSLRYRYVSWPSSCPSGTDMCPRPLHVS